MALSKNYFTGEGGNSLGNASRIHKDHKINKKYRFQDTT